MNTFIVTNANDCPNLLSHGATFRMGVLLPNYPEENVVKACGENVPNFKYHTSTTTSTGTSSNVFQILQDLLLKQYQKSHPDSLQMSPERPIPVYTVQPVQHHSRQPLSGPSDHPQPRMKERQQVH